jgi:hypothetical protein
MIYKFKLSRWNILSDKSVSHNAIIAHIVYHD